MVNLQIINENHYSTHTEKRSVSEGLKSSCRMCSVVVVIGVQLDYLSNDKILGMI